MEKFLGTLSHRSPLLTLSPRSLDGRGLPAHLWPLGHQLKKNDAFVQSPLAPLGPKPAFGVNEREVARKSEPQLGTPRPLTPNGHLSSLLGTPQPEAILADHGNLPWGHTSIEPPWHTMGILFLCWGHPYLAPSWPRTGDTPIRTNRAPGTLEQQRRCY